MYLKFCYRPNSFLILNGIDSLEFTSYTESEFVYDRTKHYPAISILTSPSYLNEERGCARCGDTDNTFYLNQVDVSLVPLGHSDEIRTRTYLFSGSAYLCDDSGKTIDVLR